MRSIRIAIATVVSVCVSLSFAAPTVTARDCAPKQPNCGATRLAQHSAGGRVLREARAGEAWVTADESALRSAAASGGVALPAAELARLARAQGSWQDSSAPILPDALSGDADLFGVTLRWAPATNAGSGIAYYAYALGTGTTTATEADLRWWQSTALETSVRASLALTEGLQLYGSVYAVNGAGARSAIVRVPLIVKRDTFGDASNALSYRLAPQGIDASGAPAPAWTDAQRAEIAWFIDRMTPVIGELYGPPSISYTVTLIRDLRRTQSAIFYPGSDAIHLGDNAPYQLITHELIHAWRNDRLLSSDAQWRYDPTLSGFEEGFAQAVSYAAMTEFARRYPEFPLTDKIYQSSHEWDYDFLNKPELGTTDFWSDSGGTQLFWTRYEMAAAAIAKIERSRPGFYKAFNAEFYARLNQSVTLTMTRDAVVDMIAAIAPSIEGQPARVWIDRQHIFASRATPGPKVWHDVQHYPSSADYYVFSRVHTYDTFANGSDWAELAPDGGWRYYSANGSRGEAALYDINGSTIATRTLAISPTINPPALMKIGYDTLALSTADSHLPWPGGDGSRMVTSLHNLGLYRVESTFASPTRTASAAQYSVVGAPLRGGAGIWGGVIGVPTGSIEIAHPAVSDTITLSITQGAFFGAPSWASIPHTATGSVDTLPGVLAITVTLPTGAQWVDARAIQYGSWSGNQAFLFDIAGMTPVRDPLSLALTNRVYLPVTTSVTP
jgi:hypothetical protein